MADFHTYAVDWTADKVDFHRRRAGTHAPMPPAYPMQLMVGVFDFPEKSDGTDLEAVPDADRGLRPRVSTLIGEVARRRVPRAADS